mmetsp:Transcript_10995/g.21893  ORF Transcript_10995/g.21893 Transcript_10995/m.21893 type:complete len:226 (-) Transcript_10995:33-710(-)
MPGVEAEGVSAGLVLWADIDDVVPVLVLLGERVGHVGGGPLHVPPVKIFQLPLGLLEYRPRHPTLLVLANDLVHGLGLEEAPLGQSLEDEVPRHVVDELRLDHGIELGEVLLLLRGRREELRLRRGVVLHLREGQHLHLVIFFLILLVVVPPGGGLGPLAGLLLGVLILHVGAGRAGSLLYHFAGRGRGGGGGGGKKRKGGTKNGVRERGCGVTIGRLITRELIK